MSYIVPGYPTYTPSQAAQLWIDAGGDPSVAGIMGAITVIESGGHAGAVNPTDNHGTQTSWGLWQISDGTHGQPVPNILSPIVNAREAVAKYSKGGFRPWGPDESEVTANGSAAATVPTGQPVPDSTYVGGIGANDGYSGAPDSSGGTVMNYGGETSATVQDAAYTTQVVNTAKSGPPQGGGYWSLAMGALGGIIAGAPGVALGTKLGSSAQSTTSALVEAGDALAWIMSPANWVRMIAALGGFIIIGFGIYMVSSAR